MLVIHRAFGEPTPVTLSHPGAIRSEESSLKVRTVYRRPSASSTPLTKSTLTLPASAGVPLMSVKTSESACR